MTQVSMEVHEELRFKEHCICEAVSKEDEGISPREQPYHGQGHKNADTFWDIQIDPFGRHGRRRGQSLCDSWSSYDRPEG